MVTWYGVWKEHRIVEDPACRALVWSLFSCYVTLGMEGVDKEKVQKVIYEMSKGSKYFENEQRKEVITKQKIEHLRAQCAKLTDNDISHFQKVQRNMFLC